jgi:hypothetical protein
MPVACQEFDIRYLLGRKLDDIRYRLGRKLDIEKRKREGLLEEKENNIK